MAADLIAPQDDSTPRAHGDPRRASREVPVDVLKEASRRLQIAALLATILWVVVAIVFHLRSDGGRLYLSPFQWDDNFSVFGAVTSAALYLYAKRTTRGPQFILNLGLVYLVLTSTIVGVMSHWPDEPITHHIVINPTISWIGMMIVTFAAIIPTSTKKTVVTGLISASMNPLGMFIAKERGMWDSGPYVNMLLMHLPDYLLVGIAVVITKVVTQLGQKVSKAREMGAYQLGELIKRGGMGEVYRATHRMLARPAAIKLIRPEMLGAERPEDSQIVVRRFHREATAAANLRSPHTVELFDFGVTEDETLYFVMELLEGMDLETLVQKHGPLPASRVVHILCQACESLQEAHEAGLVHRDIKPANIHVGRLGIEDDFVKVLDFGLVKSVAKTSDVSFGTGLGLTPGTPAYMAPEMALGEDVDGRADLYALGCVAYYLLTGKLVYDAETSFQLIARHLQHQPIPPSQRGAEVPPDLENVVLSCLAKNPDDRPENAAKLRESLSSLNIDRWSDAEAKAWWRENVATA